jgi:PAS domain S-box-containing protein
LDIQRDKANLRESLRRYAIAVGCVGAGLVLRFALRGFLGESVPYVTLYPAVVFAAMFGGLWPGILATILSLGAVVYFLLPTFHRVKDDGDLLRAALFVAFSIFLSAFSEALRRSRASSDRDRELLQITLSSIGDAVIATDADGKVTFLNVIAEGLTGWSQQDAAGRAIAEVFVVTNERTGLPAEIPVDKVIREGAVVNLANHTVLRTRDGRDIPIEDSAAPICGNYGRVLGVVLVFRDVTARRRSEEAVERSEERLKLALDAGKVGVWDWDIVRDHEEWSDRVYEILGVDRSKAPGRVEEFTALIHPEDRARIQDAIRASVDQNAPYDVEFRVIHPDGSLHWVSSTAQVLQDGNGKPVRMLGANHDITQRKRGEEQLRQQWHTFDTALSNTPDFTYIFDIEGRFLYVNRALLSLWQRPLEDAVGKNFFDLGYPPDLAERLQRQIQEVIDTKAPLRDHTPFTGPDGETGHYEYIFVPIISSGRVESVAGSTRDVTERSRTEEALRKSEERLNLALEAGGGVGTWDYDVRTDRLYCNARFAEIFSVDPKRAAQGAPLSEFIAAIRPEDRGEVAEKVQIAIETGGEYSAEYRVVLKDGSQCWLSARGRGHLDEAGNSIRFPGVVIDITGRKKTEEALRTSQDQLRLTYGGMYEYLGLLSVDGIILDCNPASLRFADNTREDVLGRLFWETPWFTATPGMPEIVRSAVAQVAAGESVRTEMVLIRPSGEALTFDFSMHPIRNERGEVVLMVPEGRDITDQKRAEEELKRSNDELTRVNRELEEFAYVASHDLQEPLRMVNIYTELILSEMGPEQTEAATYAGFVQQGVRRMEGLIQDLLTFSRAVHSDRLPVGTADLSVALNEALSVLKSRMEECGSVITADCLPKARGDASQMAHVFQNLVSNALKYSKPGVAPQIHVSARQDGQYWIISIRDNGIGFEPQYAERIFGLFKRLYKEEYPGTGLGLAICKRIVERYGGRIWAEGRPGDGATFYFSLPRVE